MTRYLTERQITHGSIDNVARGLAHKAHERTQDRLNARVDFGAVGDGIADDTAALQTAINEAFAQQKELYIPTGIYRTTSELVHQTPSSPDRAKRLRIVGEGAGNPFMVWSISQGGSYIKRTTPGTVFRLTAYDYPTDAGATNSLEIEGITFAADNAATTAPVVRIDRWYGNGTVANCNFFQRGTGDGLDIGYMVTTRVTQCYVLNKDWMTPSLGPSRTGVGVRYNVHIDGGGAVIDRVTSRGFLTGFEIGTAGPGIVYGARVTNCETSITYHSVRLGNFCRWAHVDAIFTEGGDGGDMLIVDGQFNTVQSVRSFLGFKRGCVFTSTSMANTVSDCDFVIGVDDGRGVVTDGAWNKVVGCHFVLGSGGTNAIGMEINSPIEAHANTFNPENLWSGVAAGAIAVVNNVPNSAANGNSGGQRGGAPLLYNGGVPMNGTFRSSFSRRWDTVALTQADIDSTPRANTLHLRDTDMQVFAPTAPCTVANFENRYLVGKHIFLRVDNDNPTFAPNAYLKGLSASYTPPASGCLLELIVQEDGVAIVIGVRPLGAAAVTGSRGGNAALASLLSTLEAQGLIVDNTTA